MSAKIKTEVVRKEYEEFEKDKLLDKVVDLVLENEKLKNKLKKYENPHTPSSKKKFDKPQAEGLKVGRKPGTRPNQNGATREIEKPKIIIWVETDKNPSTGNKNIKFTGQHQERLIVDFEINKTVKLYKIKEYIDLDTGDVFLASHKDIPKKGIFGKNILALTNILHFENRVTFAGIANIFTNVFNISMTTPTALDISNRVSENLEENYKKLGKEIKTSDVVNADETSSNQNGKPEWLWGFFTATIVFFVFFAQRGGDILENVLGQDFNGIIGCDGWLTYKSFSEKYGVLLQRCWAHLIREVKHVCEGKKDLEFAHIWMKEIFNNVKKSREIESEELRKEKYFLLIKELDRWTQVCQSYKELRPLVTYIKNGREFWFTCILHPEIDPTNNVAESRIRKFVILEKIMGCLRSEQGKQTTQIMLSLIGTWKQQGLNPYKTLVDLISA